MSMSIESSKIILDKVFRHLDRLWKETKKGDLSRYVLDMNDRESVKEANAIYLLNERGTVEIDRRETDSNVNHQIFYLKIYKEKVDEYFAKPLISNEYNTYFNLHLKKETFVQNVSLQNIYNKTIIKKDHQPPYFIDNLCFSLLISSGRHVHIPFYPTSKSDNTDPFVLMEALVNELEEHRIINGSWHEVDVSRKTLTERIIKQHPEYKGLLSGGWYKSTRGNLKKKTPKIMLPLMDFRIKDKKLKVYKFSLKVPRTS